MITIPNKILNFISWNVKYFGSENFLKKFPIKCSKCCCFQQNYKFNIQCMNLNSQSTSNVNVMIFNCRDCVCVGKWFNSINSYGIPGNERFYGERGTKYIHIFMWFAIHQTKHNNNIRNLNFHKKWLMTKFSEKDLQSSIFELL